MKQLDLLDQLKQYVRSDWYPLHMPGHKRQEGVNFPDPFSIDITELGGFDNLHHAQGILKECMDHAAHVYGADGTYFLVNGSSGGILAAISAAVKPGGTLLMARNCHKAAYHGAFLRNVDVEYLYPQISPILGIQGGILAEDVENLLKRCELDGKRVDAVLIVSPTYDGMVSDIGAISEIVHRYQVPLVVDEAHGAHFPFGNCGDFPVSALRCGADLVIQSVHKTLPSLTQTALLHIKGDLIKKGTLEWYLRIYQSSSPSYVFMASIDRCVRYMDGEGRGRMRTFARRLNDFYENMKVLKKLRIIDDQLVGTCGIFDRDCSKILISAYRSGKSGSWLADELRKKYHMELEMESAGYGLALMSVMDTEDGFLRLEKALMEIDRGLGDGGRCSTSSNVIINDSYYSKPVMPLRVCTMSEAMESGGTSVLLEQAKGCTSAEFVYVYPPGIPILVPGERITGDIVSEIVRDKELGLAIQGLQDVEGRFIKVLGDGILAEEE